MAVFLKNRFFALYGFWEGLVWCEILPQGVGTICPYFWEVIFFAKIEKCKLFFVRAYFRLFPESGNPRSVILSIFIDFHGFAWIFMIFIDFHRFASIFIEFHRFSLILGAWRLPADERILKFFHLGQNVLRPVAPCGGLWRRIGTPLTTFTRF